MQLLLYLLLKMEHGHPQSCLDVSYPGSTAFQMGDSSANPTHVTFVL